MNGKTHQISGVAATLATTYLTIEYHEWLVTSLPHLPWLSALVTPPQTLLPAQQLLASPETGLGGNNDVNAVINLASASSPTTLAATLAALAGIVVLGLVAGQLPDLDTPYSTVSNGGNAVGRLIGGRGMWGMVIKAIFWIVNLIPHTLSLFANHFMGGHRNGIVHGLVGLFGFSFVAGWLSSVVLGTPFYGLLFFVAYFTHLMVDSFSRSGVKWFWPVVDKEFHMLPKRVCFRTANPLHNALAQAVFVLLTAWMGWGLFSHLVLGGQFQNGLDAVGTAGSTLDQASQQAGVLTRPGSSPTDAVNFLSALGAGGLPTICAIITLVLTLIFLGGVGVAGFAAYPEYVAQAAQGNRGNGNGGVGGGSNNTSERTA